MNPTQVTISQFIQHLRSHDEPLMVGRNGLPPQWSDGTVHNLAYQEYPELYALLSLGEGVQPWQQVRILFQILQASRVGMAKEVRYTLERVTDFLTTILPWDRVLTVFLALRRVRANHKHTSRAILKYILNHPDLEAIASSRRAVLVDCLEHAVGKNVARGCAKILVSDEIVEASAGNNISPGMGMGYLRRHFLRFARDEASVKQILAQLYEKGNREIGKGEDQLSHSQAVTAEKKPPSTITATNRGDISATLVHLYRGGTSVALQQALENYVIEAAGQLPRFNGKLALVLDNSASTKGYGDREYCCISQSVALQLVLAKCCSHLEVYLVGDVAYLSSANSIPIPEGNTDIANTLINALSSKPDLVAIVSDGYENVYPGDLARVMATLPQIGMETPVVFCHSKFTSKDDLNLRKPGQNLPQLEFWHQDDFEPLLISIFAMASNSLSEPSLREFLLKKLDLVLSHLNNNK